VDSLAPPFWTLRGVVVTVKYLRANQSVVVRHPESNAYISVHDGDKYRSDDPLVKVYGWLFSSDSDLPVEQATAEPGGRRGLRR